MPVAGVLHCNVNVRDARAAAAVYEALGLRVAMRSRSDAYDATPMGLPRATSGDAWFLYDARGGRRAPAVELLEWLDPPTAGDAYATPQEVGLQAVRFAVGDPDAAAVRAVGAGAARAGDGPDGAVTLLDADGARIELVAADVEAPELRALRLVSADVAHARVLYEALGFRGGDPSALVWRTAGATTTVREVVLTSPGPPGLDVHLTAWPGPGSGRAHPEPHHRGLFRVALAVADVAEATTAARGAGADVGEPVWVPMPGTPLGGLRVAFLRDADGVMVELVERDLGAR